MTPWAKRLAILLAISMGVNLLLLGVMLGRGISGSPRSERNEPWPAAMRERGREVGPRMRPSALHKAMDRHSAELRRQREAVAQARDSAREALTAPEFDPKALEQAFATLRTETVNSQELTHRAISEAAANAPPEQRRELGRALSPKDRGRSKK